MLRASMKPALELMNCVWAAGTDGPPAARDALVELEADVGLVSWNCMAHTLRRVAASVADALQDDLTGPLEKLVWFVRELAPSGEALLRGCGDGVGNGPGAPRSYEETRAVGLYAAASRVVREYGKLRSILRPSLYPARPWSSTNATSVELSALVDGPAFAKRLKFFKAVLLAIFRAARVFDTPQGRFTNCFAYSGLNAAVANVQRVCARAEFAANAQGVREQDRLAVAQTIVRCWDVFHKPVNAAGFVLCHVHHEQLCRMLTADNEEFRTLLDNTADALCNAFRIWDPAAASTRDGSQVPNDSCAVVQYRRLIVDALEAYVISDNEWSGFDWTDFHAHPELTDPVHFWALKAPRLSALRIPAARVVSLSVVIAGVEHVIRKADASGAHEGNCGLTFGNLELVAAEQPPAAQPSWAQMVASHEQVVATTPNDAGDEAWVDALVAKWRASEEAAKASRRGYVDANAVPVVLDVPVQAPELSARGRQRIKKVFGDAFVRADAGVPPVF